MMPRKPNMTQKEIEVAQKKFLNGENAWSEKKSNEPGKWYNLLIPAQIHAEAKYNASMEGISLAEYYIRAIKDANNSRK